MKTLTEIEREARRTRELIAELKSYTPKFNAAKERAEDELWVHLGKIDLEREHLEDLMNAASVIVQYLGAEVPPSIIEDVLSETGPTEATEDELAAVMAADQVEQIEQIEQVEVETHEVETHQAEIERTAEPCDELVAMIDSPQEIDAPQVTASDDHAEILDAEPTFETIGAIAAEITAHVAAMAGDQPSTPDATDEPELTDEQVERVEEDLAAAPVRELETVGAPPRRFSTFAGNPFA